MSEDRILEALNRIESREAGLLAWGAVSGRWTRDELVELLSETGDPEHILKELEERLLLLATPDGEGYRSRSAETIRLLAHLRQSFRGQPVTEGRPLVLDYRYIHRPRKRPARHAADAEAIVETAREIRGEPGARCANALTMPTMSGFQRRSSEAILRALDGQGTSGVVVTAGTGAGKSLAFYLPLLTDLATRPRTGTSALAIYPRNELLKDQLRAVLTMIRRMGTPEGARGLSVATWFGDTPTNANYVQQGWTEGWKKSNSPAGWICPFLSCLEPGCDGPLLWAQEDVKAAREALRCLRCSGRVAESELRLTRDRAQREPADLMLTTTESLNRQLAARGTWKAFGLHGKALRAVLLDEAHIYEGTGGAQNALLFRRLRHALGQDPIWVGLSATLRNAREFFAQLVGTDDPTATVAVAPGAEELQDAGAEYLLALRHDPTSGTGVLSLTIQTCMALTRCLDSLEDNPFDPPPSSELVFGSRVFAFADKLDSTNRLYWDVLDAEGQVWPGRPNAQNPNTLAHSRAETQDRLDPRHREAGADRDAGGQWWWLPEKLGHRIGADVALQVGRTSSQDRGVAADAQVVVATASLEVGFDDDRVGAVVQHKAPRDAAQFLQRKGRAGRNIITRPWTVVTLSDWGADRRAWESYEQMFDPELPPRHLPLTNRYVLRIQAVYSMLDWIAAETRAPGHAHSSWADLSGPAADLHPTNAALAERTGARQAVIAELMGKVLRPGPERVRLRNHLSRALSLKGPEAQRALDSVLWDAPRPLLLAVVPTVRRRLLDQWAGERPLSNDRALRTRTPLREFVPGNLFDELLVPDVEFLVPAGTGTDRTEHLPALRALTEYCPGNVSRHFGVHAGGKRHWIPLPDDLDEHGNARVEIRDTYSAVRTGEITVAGGEMIPVHSPVAARLVKTEPSVKDSTAMRPDWQFEAQPLGEGRSADLDTRARALISDLRFHLHRDGGGTRVTRYATTASGIRWEHGTPHPTRAAFGTRDDGIWAPAAVGVEIHCDALVAVVAIPEPPEAIERQERTDRILDALTGPMSRLPAGMTFFERTTLAQCALYARARNGPGPVNRRDLSGDLREGLDLLGAADAADNHGGADGIDDRRWEDWTDDPDVLDAVQAALEDADRPTRDPDWVTWWRRRFCASVGNATLQALAALHPGAGAGDLLLDLPAGREDTFVVSESSPGGVGHVETFAGLLEEDPDLFTRALADVLRPADLELMDRQLAGVLACADPRVRDALTALRTSWEQGNAAARAAVEEVDRAVAQAGLFLGSAARKALAIRLFGAGAHPDLREAVNAWLRLREETRERSGIEIDARLLGALAADRTEDDVALRLPAGANRRRRARAVANVLWSWGADTVEGSAHNPYAPRIALAVPTVRELVDLRPVEVPVDDWDTATRVLVRDTLLRTGEVLLRAAGERPVGLRRAVLDLQTEPLEVGPLLCHPVVVGGGRDGDTAEVHLVLREAR